MSTNYEAPHIRYTKLYFFREIIKYDNNHSPQNKPCSVIFFIAYLYFIYFMWRNWVYSTTLKILLTMLAAVWKKVYPPKMPYNLPVIARTLLYVLYK
jgi:hypothetical protein